MKARAGPPPKQTEKKRDGQDTTPLQGTRLIRIEFDEQGPATVMHDGQRYDFTGKTGTHLKTGLAVREMATARDARLWISLDGEHLWED